MKKSIFPRFFLLTGLTFLLLLPGQAQQEKREKLSYISPLPGSGCVMLHNDIAFRHGEAFDPATVDENLITVTGTRSGRHEGKFILTGDRLTLIYKIALPYHYKETVTVEMKEGLRTVRGTLTEPVTFSFYTLPSDNRPLIELCNGYLTGELTGDLMQREDGQQRREEDRKPGPSIAGDFPDMEVIVSNDPTPGYAFLTPFSSTQNQSWLAIIDNYGTPVFYREIPALTADFKIQQEHLTYFQAASTMSGLVYGNFLVMDDAFRVVDTFDMGNGYQACMYDFRLLPGGHSLLLTYDPQPVGMDTVVPGGNPNATVIGCVFQELDADKNVVFQWRSWDHFSITDATPDIDLTADLVDYCHLTSLEACPGGYLISSRNMDEITRIDGVSGAITWRLNGENNEFSFPDDTSRFSHQHDARHLADGHLTLFDNGNLHTLPYSRVAEYLLDEVNKTASLSWTYPGQPGGIFSPTYGNAQRMPNGNTMIGWGMVAKTTEVDPDGNKRFEMVFNDPVISYRAYRFPFQTGYFETLTDTIDFGIFTGNVPMVYLLQIKNISSDTLVISDVQNHLPVFYTSSAFPMSILPLQAKSIILYFNPDQGGEFHDVLTLICEPDSLTRICRQVLLMGSNDDTPPAATFNPAHGATGVATGTDIFITFDEPVRLLDNSPVFNMDLADIIDFRENDAAGEPQYFEGTVSPDQMMFTINPGSLLKNLQQYYVAILPGWIEDEYDNPISDTVYCQFTTGAAGTGDIYGTLQARAFPNPGKGLFYLEFESENPIDISVFNAMGEQVWRGISIPGGKTLVDLQDEQPGMFFLRIKEPATGKQASLKLTKL
jgi:hypothetical protein